MSSICPKTIIYASLNQVITAKLTNFMMNFIDGEGLEGVKNKYELYKEGVTSLLTGIIASLKIKYVAILASNPAFIYIIVFIGVILLFVIFVMLKAYFKFKENNKKLSNSIIDENSLEDIDVEESNF